MKISAGDRHTCTIPCNITKTCPCNIQRFFSEAKIKKFIGKKKKIFYIFAKNVYCWYTLRLAEVLMSTHNVCFGSKIRKVGIPLQAQVFYIKVGVEGVYISRTCFPDADIYPLIPHLYKAKLGYVVEHAGYDKVLKMLRSPTASKPNSRCPDQCLASGRSWVRTKE